MKKFKATKYKEGLIELSDAKQLEEAYNTIQKEEDFILEWKEGEVIKSEVMISTDFSSKLKTGDIKLTACQAGGTK